jgi:hypothetical protein
MTSRKADNRYLTRSQRRVRARKLDLIAAALIVAAATILAASAGITSALMVGA